MSRLGKKPIKVPKGVEAKFEGRVFKAKGPKGELAQPIPEGIELEISDGELKVDFKENSKLPYPRYGLYRTLIENALTGVSTGFEKKLTLIGVGYRAALKGQSLDLQLGFSHPCSLEIPKGIEVKIDKSTLITVSGVDRQVVGQFAADVRALRPPEPYKGKGVRYEDEYVRKKAGKAAKGK